MERPETPATKARLEDWLKSKIPNARNLTMSWLRNSEGGSNETHFVDATWEEGGTQKVGFGFPLGVRERSVPGT